jgi:dipeptidase E
MKRLLLTSDGLSSRKIRKEFLKLLDKPADETRVLVMHTANTRRRWRTVRRIAEGLKDLGIRKENILLVNIRHDAPRAPGFDVFYALGGNTYYILDRVRKTGFGSVIKKAVGQGKLYIGLSAGSMIVHKTIEFAGWGTDRGDNEIGLRDLRGLNLTDVAIFPHCNKKRSKGVALFRKNTPYPIVGLKDGQALEVIGNKTKIIK